MKRKGLNLRNYIVRGLTYTTLFFGAEFTVGYMIITTVDKLFF